MKYFLLGYMGSGKTKKGRKLAQKLGLDFIDLDEYICEKELKTVQELFSEIGEKGFRDKETFYLKEICCNNDNFILSTGGGTPCFNENMEFMNEEGYTIFLDTDIDILVERLIKGKHKRPLLRDLNDEELREFIQNHIAQRLPFYQKAKEVRKYIKKQ
ncbi:MAG: shikimate kinase [Odoribacter sp.]|nr:shikimate kinase [Odoribacter sp.]